MSKLFCAFILTHGRADNCITYQTLKKSGYTGPVFFVVDNEDRQIEKYQKNFGKERVIIFDKKAMALRTDCADNFNNRKVILHARNACFDIAKNLGFQYFIELDDDYTYFCYIHRKLKNSTDYKIKQFDKIINPIIEFINSDERISSICFLQTGDTIGGMQNFEKWNSIYPFQKRKAMNSFFCKTDRRFWFQGTINEDVNTYVVQGSRGSLFFTIPDMLLQQRQTQKNKGGMTDIYLESGTYVKSFYTIIFAPSSAQVTVTPSMQRLHHKINWNNAVPKIIGDEWKK